MDEIRLRLVSVLGTCFNSGSTTEESIASAETKLGLLFPPSYRIFLTHFGASLCQGFEVYGLPSELGPEEPPQWGNVIDTTTPHRPNTLPENSVGISHDGMDHGYFLHCSKSEPLYEGPVIEWGPDHDGGKIIASSFVEFVEGSLRT